MEVGETKNSWTFLARLPSEKNKTAMGEFLCVCGETYVKQISNINNGHSTRCRNCAHPKIDFEDGEKINSWTFIRFIESKKYDKRNVRIAEFKCECGVIKFIQARSVRYGTSKCCVRCSKRNKGKFNIDIGDKINRWTFLKYAIEGKYHKGLFECECGLKKEHAMSNVIRGLSRGCRSCTSDNSTPREFYSELFDVWHKMLKNNKGSIIPRWQIDFALFATWAKKNGYKVGEELVRKDDGLDFSPFNCKFK